MLLGGIVTDDHVVAMRWWGGEVVVACKRFTRRTGGLWRDKWLWFMDRLAQGALSGPRAGHRDVKVKSHRAGVTTIETVPALPMPGCRYRAYRGTLFETIEIDSGNHDAPSASLAAAPRQSKCTPWTPATRTPKLASASLPAAGSVAPSSTWSGWLPSAAPAAAGCPRAAEGHHACASSTPAALRASASQALAAAPLAPVAWAEVWAAA